MARPFILEDQVLERIKKVIAYAEAHPIVVNLKTVTEGTAPRAGDDRNFVVSIPVGYQACFSIEHQPAGKIRHLSVSVNNVGKLPNPFIVETLLPLFGFENKLENCKIWLEELADKRQAINIIEVAVLR